MDPTHDDDAVMNGAPKVVLWVGHPPPRFVSGPPATPYSAASSAVASPLIGVEEL